MQDGWDEKQGIWTRWAQAIDQNILCSGLLEGQIKSNQGSVSERCPPKPNQPFLLGPGRELKIISICVKLLALGEGCY